MPKTITILYEEQGLTAKQKTANELCGPCPWCGGKDRFTLFTEQGIDNGGRFWCRQCGKNGDTITFLRELTGMSFREALTELGLPKKHHTGTPATQRRPSPPKPPEFSPVAIQAPDEQWQLKAAEIIFAATACLRDSPELHQWLATERGISLKTALAFGLGWIKEDIYRPREAFNLPQELNAQGNPKKVWIPRGLSIPVISRKGDILRVKIRVDTSTDPNRPKYIPIPQTEKCTAPLIKEHADSSLPWQIVESELDALLLSQEAVQLVNIVAIGSASYRPDKETWEKLKAAPRVLISLDYDAAGNKAACTWWKANLPAGRAKLWPVPEGKDPCDTWKAGWNLFEWVKSGIQ